jgi:hypothetical protein
MVWEASEWDFTKKGGSSLRFLKFTADADGRQDKHEDAYELWNALCTAKLKEA